jgi:hypothetical protein
MSPTAWIFSIVWPIVVVVAYSFIVDRTMKARAKFITDHFNLTGRAIIQINADIAEIKARQQSDDLL